MKLENQRELKLVITTKQWENDGEAVESQTVIDAVGGISDGVRVLIYEIEETLNVLMITDNYVKLVKSGDVEADMTFAVGKMTDVVFTAAGKQLTFEAYTKECRREDTGVLLDINYILLSGGQPLSEYELNIVAIHS